MSKLRVMQQNFIQTHKSKIFDLERQIDPSNPSNLNVQEKIELYRNSMSRCETDIHLNNQKLEQLKMHLSNGASFDILQNYDTVDISPRVTAIHPVPIDRSFDSSVTLEVSFQKNLTTLSTFVLNFSDFKPKTTLVTCCYCRNNFNADCHANSYSLENSFKTKLKTLKNI